MANDREIFLTSHINPLIGHAHRQDLVENRFPT